MSDDLIPLIETLARLAGVTVDARRLEGQVRRTLADWAALMPAADPDDEP